MISKVPDCIGKMESDLEIVEKDHSPATVQDIFEIFNEGPD